MSDIVIKAEGLGKKYLISHQSEREKYFAIRDVMGRALKSFVKTAADAARGKQLLIGDEVEEFWALREMNFEIRRGDVVGVVGRNGAGKSTLLKVLSRITEPSAGQVTIKGRVASLLEVGTGFHQELTGRENIFLNGAILGMTRKEVKRKFDEIVEFAEVEKFLDTPVKRYSSGMYVRLAFSVAAHLEPEILIVDEVLAVGDQEFQRKCLGKMDDVAKGGRTVLFVSHNMTTIQNLCERAIFLHAGNIVYDGSVPEAISCYAKSSRARGDLPEPHTRKGNGKVRILSIETRDDAGVGDNFWMKFELDVKEHISGIEARLGIYAANGLCVAAFANSITGDQFGDISKGRHCLQLRIPALPLNIGQYTFNISLNSDLGSSEVFDRIEGARNFSISAGDPFRTGQLPTAGAVVVSHNWLLDSGTASE